MSHAIAERPLARPGEAALPQPGVTAVICTRERPAQLERALRSLLAQSTPAAEIIVVDNAPDTRATRELVAAQFPAVRYLEEAEPGLDFARNRALRAASQDVVVFLDDDAVADAAWAAQLARPFAEDVRLGACTGRVEALTLEHEGQRIVEANGGYARGPRALTLPPPAEARLRGRRAPLIAWAVSIGSGCSLAIRRDAALALGGFDVRFGGRDLPGGDDHDMLWRMLAAGHTVRYEPAALAWHEHRRTADEAYSQIAGHQRGLIAFLAKAARHGTLRQRAGVISFLGWRLSKPGFRLLRRLAGRDPLPARVLARMWRECWIGLFSYAGLLPRRRTLR